MPIRALLRPLATGVLIVASAGALAANASARQAAVAFTETAMPTWPQPANAAAQARPLVAQVFFVDARADQARIRARASMRSICARADDRLNGRVQPREGGGRSDWQQQQERERMHQERGNGDRGGDWRGSRRG